MSEKKSISTHVKSTSGVDVSHCYQCGKCTAGCVQAERMDYPPQYIMSSTIYENWIGELKCISD